MSRVDGKAIERAVMADQDRPCLYGVMGPCFHPNCLEAHFDTLVARYTAQHYESEAEPSND